jgi:MFS family permease
MAMNRNVSLNLVLAFMQGLADNIWTGTVLVAYLYDITDQSNTKVGLVTALQGASQFLTALPAGWAADVYSRSSIVAVGGTVQLMAIAVLVVSVLFEKHESMDGTLYMSAAGLVLYGFSGGAINGPAQALLADSLPTGYREKYYNLVFILYIMAGVGGPALCILLFKLWGDQWTLPELRTLLLIGLFMEIPAAIIMFFFRDDKSLGKESEAYGEGETKKKTNEAAGDSGQEKGGEEDEEDDMSDITQMTACGGLLTIKSIPYIVFGADLIIALASGMTIKFFPLFFKNDCKMSPAEVQTVYLIVPIVMCICSTLGTSVSKVTGRVQAVILLRFSGLGCFASMVVMYHHQVNRWAIVAVYICRTALMNSTYPLEESILMDYVPKNTRARWKSLESVSIFGWCGSAAIGGVLADKFGYAFCFVITICMQATATLMYTSLVFLVAKTPPKKSDDKSDEEGVEDGSKKQSGVGGSGGAESGALEGAIDNSRSPEHQLSEPLLSIQDQ